MPDAFLLDAIRTPFGRYGIAPADVDDVVLGNANGAGEDNRNVARMAALVAGLPAEVPGMTVNRLCASGLEAVNQAARMVRTGDAELVLAGGVESMTRAPFVHLKPERAFARGPVESVDTTIGWRFVNPRLAARHSTESMGETAENVADRYEVARPDQDRFALRSHQRAGAATDAGRLAREIVPVPRPDAAEPVEADEGPRRDTSLERLASLRAIFREGGSVTPGNASPVNDGAACVVVASERAADRLGVDPLARLVAVGVAGVDPAYMGIGPVPATRRALARAGLEIGDLDLVELNEAFAAQVLACQRELGIDDERLNVNGGAIALGHPLGASGARLVGTLAHELRERGARFGLATLCVGVGQGVATIIENPGAA